MPDDVTTSKGDEVIVESQTNCAGPGCHYRDPKKTTDDTNEQLVERQICAGPGCHYRDPKKSTDDTDEPLAKRQTLCAGPGCHYKDPKKTAD